MSRMENRDGLRRRDTTKGPPLRILSLDGGGVRGYSMFIILQDLMHRTFVEIEGRAPKRSEIPKPCDQFDLIVGTGTGGLIAIMLGRLRLDIETCKEVYVRMTRKVFETDKTIAGIPYRSTLFKASKLEEAIRECVREHTIFRDEGNDGEYAEDAFPPTSSSSGVSRQLSNASMMSFSAKSPTAMASSSRQVAPSRWGNPNALLYDSRENRTKTGITAVYKGTSPGSPPALLRSYDSRREIAPEFDCTIWQAGRATSATGLAFKPIQIGQSVFIDEGHGKFNPAPIVLDEAVLNEWPGREIGVFVSIGTGKRPSGTDHNKHLWYDDFLGEFAEARKRLVAKIEGCEETHQFMMKEYLSKRGVLPGNYYRLNVEVGVGEFGMNEWNRLADISTSTRRYLGKRDVEKQNMDAATKLARIHLSKMRHEGRSRGTPLAHGQLSNVPEAYPLMAIELPAEVPPSSYSPSKRSNPPRPSYDSETLGIPLRDSPRTSDEYRQQPSPASTSSIDASPRTRPARLDGGDRFLSHAPTPSQYRTAGGQDKIAIMSLDEFPRPPAGPAPPPPQQRTQTPPPLPPKTPIPEYASVRREGEGRSGRREDRRERRQVGSQSAIIPPYPLDDGPPPAVNYARKPERWDR